MTNTRMTAALLYTENATGKRYLATLMLNLDKAIELANEYNTEKPERIWNGELAKCDERTYFAEMVETWD